MSDKDITVDMTEDKKYEDRQEVEQVRNADTNKIESYRFKILIRDEKPFEGELTRKEMEQILALYTNMGGKLTQAVVAREFSQWTFEQFKKILRAFKITKASPNLAPHILEETTEQQQNELNEKIRETVYVRQQELRADEIVRRERDKARKELYDFKKEVKDFTTVFQNFNISSKINPIKPEIDTNKTLMVYLSDMHIGASVSRKALYGNDYNEEIIYQRMQMTHDYIMNASRNYNITNVHIVNTGDSLDGMNKQTTRGGHILPQNMDDQDQHQVFVDVMLSLFKRLEESGLFSTVSYTSVGDDNHSGISGWAANKMIEMYLKGAKSNVKVNIFDKIMDHFVVNDHTFILHHGKDSKDMFRNMPLTLNDKIEKSLMQYIIKNDIPVKDGKVSIVKGDLHQSATTYGNFFRYKSVSSFFGSSQWAQANFPTTNAGVDFDILDANGIMETRIILN